MKIAVNTRLLIPDKMDGIGRFTFETLHRISKAHTEVEFTFIFDRNLDTSQFKFPSNVKIVELSPPARHPLLWLIWFEFSLKNYINKNKYDLFLSPEGWIPANLNCNSLGVIHDLNFEHHPENIIFSHRKYLHYFFPKYAKRATRIATVSNFSKEDIHSTYDIPKDKIDVVYNGANSIFIPLAGSQKTEVKKSYSEGEEYFLFVGTLHPRKNLEHLFLAFDQFKKENKNSIKLLIAGNKKWWPNKLENIYQNMEAKSDLIFLGRCSDSQLAELMTSSLALTYLPYFEGFGIPILEAFNAQTAVITSNKTSMPEVANGAAILCEPTNISEIAEAMLTVFSNETKRKQLIAKGIERAKDFSWVKTAELLWDSIEKTLR